MAKGKNKLSYDSELEKELDSILGMDVQAMSEQARMDREKQENKKDKNKKANKGKNDKKGKTEKEPVTEEPKKLGKKAIAGIVVGCICFAVLIGGLSFYISRAQAYKTVFFQGTTINSIDCSYKTVSEVEDIIKNDVEKYSLTINFRDGDTMTIDGGDIDYTYQKSNDIQEILDDQNILSWYSENKKTRDYTVESSTTFDEAKVAELINGSEEMLPLNQEAPEDAYMDFKDNKYIIVAEKVGNKIDGDVLAEAACKAIEDGETTLEAKNTDAYINPEVMSDDPDLVEKVSTLNNLAGACITYKLPQGKKVLNGKTLIKWLDKDENGKYTKDDEKFAKKIKEYVKKLAKATDNYGEEAEFETTEGSKVKVKMIDTGWQIDQEKEIKTLTENIEKAETVTREPEYKVKMSSTKNNGFGTTYIEADLTSQHVYFYKKGKVVWESDCVSGKMTEDRYTPEGVYLLDYKQKDRDLKGKKLADGTYSYISHVSYWMPFNGGYGFHDATWRYSFGGKIYNYYGSHGCINLPLAKAETLYDLIDEDVPIVIFYREEYKLRAAEPAVTSDGEGTKKTTTATTDTTATDDTKSTDTDNSTNTTDNSSKSSSSKSSASSKSTSSSSKSTSSSSKSTDSSSESADSSSKSSSKSDSKTTTDTTDDTADTADTADTTTETDDDTAGTE